MSGTLPLIAVYIVTYRRHEMLRRAVASVLAQTHRNIIVKVINDDPADGVVQEIIREFDDSRISLFLPVERRGGPRNFNIAFSEKRADFLSLLEDDNWWEPEFLERQLKVLEDHLQATIVVGNERIHRELPDGSWLDTGQTIWPFRHVVIHAYRAEDVCGTAKICNSSMLVRVRVAAGLQTPDTIAIDVTEHFRERLLPPQIVLNGDPLVNYAETIQTARSSSGEVWGHWQCLLIGSLFVAAEDRRIRRDLARKLWKDCRSPSSPRAVALMASGIAIREARAILRAAPVVSIIRFSIWLGRRPRRLWRLANVRRRFSRELTFLVNAPLTRHLAEGLKIQ